jgi:hypothetical protein
MTDLRAAAERLRRIGDGETLSAVYHDPRYPDFVPEVEETTAATEGSEG